MGTNVEKNETNAIIWVKRETSRDIGR
jgi:hypothetical protein